MRRDPRLYVNGILDAIEKIESYCENASYETFSQNRMMIDAVLRNFEIIGEAAKNIPLEIKQNYPDVDWKGVAGLRDVLIHAYPTVNLNVIWDIIENKISSLKDSVSKLKSDLKE